MFDAWRADSREMLPYDAKKARRDAELIDAKVLSNRKPPYGLAGGLYDALKATNGDIMVATNAQSKRACKLFKDLEGIDIYPAPGVALASLIKMVEAGQIDKDACIMLNITGAGEEAAKKNRELWYLKPSKVFPLTATLDEVVTYVESLF
jgi:cysteate synthase